MEWYKTLHGVAKIWAKKIYRGGCVLEDVPELWRDQVAKAMPKY